MTKKEMRDDMNSFAETCKLMNTMANICRNWLQGEQAMPTEMLRVEGGGMRSVRLARLVPITHEVTAQSALQRVVMPAAFDDPLHCGFAHQRWQLLVYSWLDQKAMQSLLLYLDGRLDCRMLSFFRVTPSSCINLKL